MATSTTTRTTTNLSHSRVLVDYELHHSSPPAAEGPVDVPRTAEQTGVSNPPDWPTDHRRVPAYRPINTHLDPAERIVFSNRGEQMFIRAMFFGIQVVTAFHRTWTMTAGKLSNGKIFCYDLGGEY